MKICIDPGHGGFDPGAVNPVNGHQESKIVLAVGLKLKWLLNAAGHAVVMTRKHTLLWPLWYRAWVANQAKADLFISLHCNGAHSTKVSGIETFKYTGSRSAHGWRASIHQSLVSNFPHNKDRGVKSANYAVLRRTKMPAVLVELEFITNFRQSVELATRAVQQRYAGAIFEGIEHERL